MCVWILRIHYADIIVENKAGYRRDIMNFDIFSKSTFFVRVDCQEITMFLILKLIFVYFLSLKLILKSIKINWAILKFCLVSRVFPA